MYSHLLGWVENKAEVDKILSNKPFPLFKSAAKDIHGSGRGKTMLGHIYLTDILGYFPLLVQEIGDCTSFGAAGMTNAAKAYRIKKEGKMEDFGGITSTEDLYGGSRVIIGKNQLRGSDGSLGVWIAEYLVRYGTLVRKVYGNIDLTKYSGQRARDWGNNGPPKELLPIAADHTFNTYSKVTTYEEVRDSLYNGYFVTVASNQAFYSTRDSDGFAAPDYNNQWPHQMYLIAVDDEYRRPGVLCVNSWPKDWINGPKRHNQPDGSFWIDAEILEKRMLISQDCFSFSEYNGYPPNSISPVFI